VTSYYHTIHSDEDFLEHTFPKDTAAGHEAAWQHGQQPNGRMGLFDLDSLLDLQQEAERLSAAVESFTTRLQQQSGGGSAVNDAAGPLSNSSSRGGDVEEAGRLRRPRVQLVQERFTSW
jgi:hypothetical protein